MNVGIEAGHHVRVEIEQRRLVAGGDQDGDAGEVLPGDEGGEAVVRQQRRVEEAGGIIGARFRGRHYIKGASNVQHVGECRTRAPGQGRGRNRRPGQNVGHYDDLKRLAPASNTDHLLDHCRPEPSAFAKDGLS